MVMPVITVVMDIMSHSNFWMYMQCFAHNLLFIGNSCYLLLY